MFSCSNEVKRYLQNEKDEISLWSRLGSFWFDIEKYVYVEYVKKTEKKNKLQK